MAAIIPFLENQDENGESLSGSDYGLGATDGAPREFTPLPLERTHTELTNTYWTRRSLETEVAKRAFRVDQDGRDFWIYFLHPKTGAPWPIPKDVVPWSQMPQEGPVERVSLLSTNSKMRCPTWDLPAGAFTLGGTCPASAPAQTTSAAPGRVSRLPILQPDGHEHETPVEPQRAVCQYCYASGAAYKYASTQLAEVAHYQLVRSLLSQGRTGRQQFVQLMVEAIVAAPGVGRHDLSARFGIKPIRVHSSGDFFSTDYADAWIDVAVELAKIDPSIRLWAPTRTHTIAAFRKFWPGALARIPLVPGRGAKPVPNFVIRPSGYHIGDPAPRMPFAGPTVSAGTSVLAEAESVRHAGEYYDHQCGVYALEKGNKTCALALGPDGKPGCRACWIQPWLRVNYVVH